MNISDLLGAMMQSGMSPSSEDRMKNALGGGSGGGLLESLSGMLGGQSSRGAVWDRFWARRSEEDPDPVGSEASSATC